MVAKACGRADPSQPTDGVEFFRIWIAVYGILGVERSQIALEQLDTR